MEAVAADPGYCEPGFGSPIVFGGRGGVLIPVGGDWEANWPDWWQAILYFLGLAYCFAGVAIIADVFMGAIETITSSKKLVTDKTTGRQVTIKVWNDTVANLTLMALGSSAPEILLSVIELLTNSMYSGDLGPSVIVGSAAFNLFVILGICMSALPEGETRRIKETGVFAITASFSIFAYFWLLFILVAPPTPDVVDITEGFLTFFWFPVLIVVAFLMDKGYFKKCLGYAGPKSRKLVLSRESTPEEYAEAKKEILSMYGSNLSEDHVTELIKLEFGERPTRAHYRINATRTMVCGKTVLIEDNHSAHKLAGQIRDKAPSQEDEDAGEGDKRLVSFPSEKYCCVESDQRVLVPVVRRGDLQTPLYVRYHTEDGTAHAGEDFQAKHFGEVLVFQPGEGRKEIEITLIVDNVAEQTEEFYIHLDAADGTPQGVLVDEDSLRASHVDEEMLSNSIPIEVHSCCLTDSPKKTQAQKGNKLAASDGAPGAAASDHPQDRGQDAHAAHNQAAASRDSSKQLSKNSDRSNNGPAYELGKLRMATVVIFDDDDPGLLAFKEEQIHVHDTSHEPFLLDIVVERRGGGYGKVSCSYHTEEGTALEGSDFQPASGTLTMDEDVMREVIQVKIMPKGKYEGTEHFRMILKDPQGIKFDGKTDGGNDSNILTVFIDADPNNTNKVNSLMRKFNVNYDRVQLGHAKWKDQFHSAIYVNGHSDEQEKSTWTQCAVHGLTVPWKLLFAFVPPTEYAGGWLAFGCALVMIGIVTALIGDMANLLGCALGIRTDVTGVTLVALGTSMPDTFASVAAARGDVYADNSIGNVTGSNSVNIFLGLGMPWFIGAVYWSIVGATPGDEWYQTAKNKNWPDHILRDHQGALVVVAGSLGKSVAVFAGFAFIALALLVLRRYTCDGELGGPKVQARLSTAFFIFLWLAWVIIFIVA